MFVLFHNGRFDASFAVILYSNIFNKSLRINGKMNESRKRDAQYVMRKVTGNKERQRSFYGIMQSLIMFL